MTKFKQIDAVAYFKEHASEAKLFRKDASVIARPAISGETIITSTSGGHEETVKTAGPDEMVITNPGGEEYIIGKEKFDARYELEEGDDDLPQGNKRYRAKGAPLPYIRLDEDVTFTAPWGSPMNIKAGGVLVNGGDHDVYGIQSEEAAQTYRDCDETGTFV